MHSLSRKPVGKTPTPTLTLRDHLRLSLGTGKKLALTNSFYRQTFKQRSNLHAGMLKKPLEPYQPHAFRSRLPQATVVMPYKNSSQIVIGDRSTDDKRLFKTTNQLMQIRPNLENAVTNGGILSAQTKWIHYN